MSKAEATKNEQELCLLSEYMKLWAAANILRVVSGFAPWNEALFADDAKARLNLPPYTLKLLPQLRAILPASEYDVLLNFFNVRPNARPRLLAGLAEPHTPRAGADDVCA